MATPSITGWDPDDWESYGLSLLRHRYGVALVPVPDESGGDGGLDAFTTSGVGWQCYAPENEPLKPKQRYELQRAKVTRDLGKLRTYRDRVSELLGTVKLDAWVLLTPKNESADLVVHCARKTIEVRGWGLDFLTPDFTVYVQTLGDFAAEHRLLQAAGYVTQSLAHGVELPELADLPFSSTTGPTIEVMDTKLSAVMPDDATRATYRGEMLRSQIAGEDQLANFDDQLPDIARQLHSEIAMAKRSMTMEQALAPTNQGQRLLSVQADIVRRVTEVVPEFRTSAAENVAQAAIARWLQECSMKFSSPAEDDKP